MEHLRYHLTVRLYRQDKSFGPGPMRLLRGVEEGGSLHQAAEAMGMSYSKAWTLLRKLEKEWGFTLLDRQSGGPKGGGSVLTPEGRDLLERYEAMCAQVELAAHKAFAQYFQ